MTPAQLKRAKALANKKTHELTDAEWDARGDAWALQSAQLIQSDAKRLEEAKVWAAALAITEKAEAEAFNQIANT